MAKSLLALAFATAAVLFLVLAGGGDAPPIQKRKPATETEQTETKPKLEAESSRKETNAFGNLVETNGEETAEEKMHHHRIHVSQHSKTIQNTKHCLELLANEKEKEHSIDEAMYLLTGKGEDNAMIHLLSMVEKEAELLRLAIDAGRKHREAERLLGVVGHEAESSREAALALAKTTEDKICCHRVLMAQHSETVNDLVKRLERLANVEGEYTIVDILPDAKHVLMASGNDEQMLYLLSITNRWEEEADLLQRVIDAGRKYHDVERRLGDVIRASWEEDHRSVGPLRKPLFA